MRLVALAVLAVAAVMLAAGAPVAEAKLERSTDRAFGYLERRASTSGALAANIAEAAATAGMDPAAWPEGDPIAARIQFPGPEASNVSLLRPLRALALAGDPRAGLDGELTRRVQGLVGESGYGDATALNDDAYAILALATAMPIDDDERFASMRAHLLANRDPGGGWGWAVGATPGTDMTGLVIEALLVSGGVPDDAREDAATFLATTHDADGGFGESSGAAPNCESTVWGIRASSRLGLLVTPDDWDFLLRLQQKDGGFAHLPGAGSDLLCTTEAATLLGEVAGGSVVGPDVDDHNVFRIPAPGLPVMTCILLLVGPTTLRLRQP